MPVSKNHVIEEIKNSVDIVDLISEYVDLKKTGKNYKGLCPFHQEKTPSFNVNPERQFFYCFGCGEGGDVFTFLMKIDNITFQEALKILARRSGIILPNYTGKEKKIGELRERIFKINNFVAKYYNHILTNSKTGEKAIDYLKKRGFSIEDIHKFQLGYAPQGWTTLLDFLLSRNYKIEELLKAGLIVKGRNDKLYDRFRERIIFPIFNIRGEVLAFGGRIINNAKKNTPKYLNSPETVIYRKGETLYGLNWAREVVRKTGEAVIMEGYTDVLTAQCYGLCNAVASLGTALTHKQARLLKRYASLVYIAYDADSAGEQATIRGLDVLKKIGLDVKVINLPGQMDPDEFIQKEGKDRFEKEKKNALTLMEFKIKKVIGDTDYSSPDGKVKVIKKLVYLISEEDDLIEKEMYLSYISERFNIDLSVLKREADNLNLKKAKKKDKNYKRSYTKKDNETNTGLNINKLEALVLKIYLEFPEWRKRILPYLNYMVFPPEYHDVIKIIIDNKKLELDNIIEKTNDKNLRKKLLSLIVSDTGNIKDGKIKYILDRLNKKAKLNFYKVLQRDQKMNIVKLNELLICFKQLSVNPERRELNG